MLTMMMVSMVITCNAMWAPTSGDQWCGEPTWISFRFKIIIMLHHIGTIEPISIIHSLVWLKQIHSIDLRILMIRNIWAILLIWLSYLASLRPTPPWIFVIIIVIIIIIIAALNIWYYHYCYFCFNIWIWFSPKSLRWWQVVGQETWNRGESQGDQQCSSLPSQTWRSMSIINSVWSSLRYI